MKCIVIYNASSGSALVKDALLQKFRQNSIVVKKAIAVSPSLIETLHRTLKKDDVVAVVGGDGTIASCVSSIMHASAILAPLPGGTLNHLAKDVGVPSNLDEAIANLKKARVRRIDVASVNDTYFLNNSSLGLYPTSLATRAHIEDKMGKWPAAVVGALRAFVRFRHYHITIKNRDFTIPFVFIGNNRYRIKNVTSIERSSITEGKLSIMMITDCRRWDMLVLLIRALFGRHRTSAVYKEFSASEITIFSKHKTMRISHDGESAKLSSPLHYKIHAKQLRILS